MGGFVLLLLLFWLVAPRAAYECFLGFVFLATILAVLAAGAAVLLGGAVALAYLKG